MMSVLDLSHSATLELIAAFKNRPIIYNSSTIGYNDRKMKADAWKSLSEETGIDSELCKRKMESLMASYRREKKNIYRAKENNTPYEPKWRYWNLFKFLRGIADDEEDPLGSTPDNLPEPKSNPLWSTARMLASKYQDVPYPFEPINKTKKNLEIQEDDEFTAIGATVDARLKEVTESQRIIAENLINQVLYKGLLFQLGHGAEIVDSDEALTNAQMETKSSKNDSSLETVEAVMTQDVKDSHFIVPIEYNVPLKRRRESISPNSRECSETTVEMTIL